MTARPPHLQSARAVQSRPRRVHVVMRDGAIVDAGVYLTDGQALAPYLGSRKSGWVNIVNAVWFSEAEQHNHAVLQAEHILMASGPDGDVPVHFPAAAAIPRHVDIKLEDGTRVQGSLQLADRQRMSDYLAGCGKFMPLIGATRVPGGAELGDIALNTGCVRAVRDAKVFAPGSMVSGSDGSGAWTGPRPSGAMPAAGVPVNQELVKRPNGAIEVITPARVPDRRVGQPPYKSPEPRDPRAPIAESPSMSYATNARANKLARHWLVLIAAGAQLLPPDPLTLTDPVTLDQIWRGIAARNEMAEAELAIQVAAAFNLDLANLDEATQEAVDAVPEKLARKLGVMPLRIDGDNLILAVSDPDSHDIDQQLGFVTRKQLHLVIATPDDIRGAIDWHYRATESA